MRKLCLGVLIVLGALLVAPSHAAGHYTRTDAVVRMGDGTDLEATVYLSTATAPPEGWPLIVRQHGGGSNKDNAYDTKYALAAIPRGFAVLMYSVRGHGGSEGIFDWFGPQSVGDFSQMLDWVAETFPAINTDNVGTSGYSQGGGMSLMPAASDPRVKAVAVGNTFDSLNHALNPNDCFKFSFATGIFLAAYKQSASRTDDATAARWGATFYSDTEDVGGPGVSSTTEELAARSPLANVDSLVSRRVPVFWTQSWEDQLFPADHPDNILRPLETAGVPVHYWFASGGHAAGDNDPADEAGKEAAILDWFDQFLRGVDHGLRTGPKVDYAQRVPGTSSGWTHKTAPSWPLAATPRPLYVGPEGRLSTSTVQGFSDSIYNDLANLNVGNDAITNEIARNFPGGTSTVQAVGDRGTPIDTRTFVSSPLGSPLEVTGSPVLRLDGTATGLGTVQVDAKVWDVAGDGSARLVGRGCWSGPLFIGGLDFALWPNSHIFPAGHRIGLTISTVDFPTFEPDKAPARVTFTGLTRVELPVVAGSI